MSMRILSEEEFKKKMKKLGIDYHWSEGFGELFGEKCPQCGEKGLVAKRGRMLLAGKNIPQFNYCPDCKIVWFYGIGGKRKGRQTTLIEFGFPKGIPTTLKLFKKRKD